MQKAPLASEKGLCAKAGRHKRKGFFMRRTKSGQVLLALLAATILGVAGWLVWRWYPVVQGLMEPEKMDAFRERLQSFGLMGILLLIGVQILQVISGLIPALPVQIAAGVTYGALGGLAICASGVFLGSALVFILVKRFGQPVVDRMFPPEKQRRLAFLQDSDRLQILVFIIYLIPAMPKDLLTYLAALTPLELPRFLLLTVTARIPTMLANTFASSELLEGNYLSSVIAFCITGTLGLVCMLSRKRMIAWMQKSRN